MIDIKAALHTTLLLVDDDVDQLQLRAVILRMSGFTVLTASNPVEAIAVMGRGTGNGVDVAVLDYHMPVINGCVLAEYLRSRYPDLKTILYSAAVDIPESEMSCIDVFVPKSEGVAPLLAHVSELAQVQIAREATIHESY